MSPAVVHAALMGLVLGAGLTVALVAARRGWAPPLWVALAVGAVLRLVVLAVVVRDGWQPYDLSEDFRDAADAVLAGHDPVTSVRPGGWHFLPLLAYLLAGQRELGHLVGLPWSVAGRLVPVLADLALIPLVSRLATPSSARSPAGPQTQPPPVPARSRPGDVGAHSSGPPAGPWVSGRKPAGRRAAGGCDAGLGARTAFSYACVPVGVMVSALHGQFSAIVLVFGVAALLAARAGRPAWAGIGAGLAVTSTSWAALMLPGVLVALPGRRARFIALACSPLVPAGFLASSCLVLDTPPHRLVATATAAASVRPVTGEWGWTAVITGGHLVVSPALGHVGTAVLMVGLTAAGWWWRRAEPVTLTLVLLMSFLIVTYRFGAQYLAWPVPYLLARAGRAPDPEQHLSLPHHLPRRPSRRLPWHGVPLVGPWPALAVASVWAAAGYLYLTRLSWVSWRHAHSWWALSSLVVIAALARALPPRDDRVPGPPPTPDQHAIPEPVA